MSNEFKRENRYLVLKRSDVDRALTLSDKTILSRLVELISANRKVYNKAPLYCVVVESDWPEFEPVWRMIQERMEGKAHNNAINAAHAACMNVKAI